MTEEARPLAESTLKGCAANVGPLIGVDLEVGPIDIAPDAELPDTELAVLPVSVELDDQPLCEVAVWSPLTEIATLARRLLDDGEPDKVRPINDDEVDAIGEVLNLMSGAVDQALRECVNSSLRTRPAQWWRTDDASGRALPAGEYLRAHAQIAIPGAGSVGLYFRISPKLFGKGRETRTKHRLGRVLLLGLEDELRSSLAKILAEAQVVVDSAEPDDETVSELLSTTEAIFLSGDRENAYTLVRRLRLANESWDIPSIFCLKQPSKGSVVRALDCGASYVMAVPADEISVLRVLRAARTDDG